MKPKRKPFNECTMDELYGECRMAKKIKCKRCKEPRSEWDLLEGYYLLCAGRVIQVARKYVALREQRGEDAQRERQSAWKELKGALGG